MLYNILHKEFSITIWDEAYKQAGRSTLKKYKTGAVVFKGEEVYLKGCSHVKENNGPHASIHAEQHCIETARQQKLDVSGLEMFILCLNKSGNPAFSSKPCYSCAINMGTIPIEYVYYLERMNDGTWIMNVKTQLELIAEAENSGLRLEHYAKSMRIK